MRALRRAPERVLERVLEQSWPEHLRKKNWA
jgi:hypothetical protein